MARCNPISKRCSRTDWWRDQLGMDWIGGGISEETETITEPDYLLTNVSNFVTSSSQYAVAAARITSLEINTGSGDQARTYFGWVKPDNYNHATAKLLSIGDASRDQVLIILTGADNTTRPYKFICNIVGNVGATAFLEAESSFKILRNRWYPYAVTYSGNASHTGITLYIGDGVDSSASKSTTGSYTSAYQTAAMRWTIGGSISVSPSYFGGQQMYTGVMNRVMTSGEFSEFRNSGIPASPLTMSFISSVVDFWPLISNVTSNGGTALTNNGVTFTSSKVSQAYDAISLKKIQTNNTAYQAFGNWASEGLGYWRQGTGHVPEGDVIKVVQNMNSFLTDPTVSVVINEPSTAHASGISCRQILDKIFLFYATYNDSSSQFVSLGRRESSDGLTGTTFGPRATMANTYPRFEFYGKPINISESVWIVPQFEHNTGVEYRVSVWRTTDNGSSFTKITVFEDATLKLAETSVISYGNSVIAISRAEGSGNGLYQINSSNAGLTWGTPVKINLGVGVCNASLTKYQNGLIVMSYMDRSQKFLKLSKDNIFNTVFNSPTSWADSGSLFRGSNSDSLYNLLGYPDIDYLSNGVFQVSVSTEYSATKADLQIGVGRLFNL